ncbi:nicotinamide mononucleotide transporter [bacterium]|nr:nicotinamide mononucleotide transporter [bacterium]
MRPAFHLLGGDVSGLELVAVVLAVAMVLCNLRVNPLGWPLAIASSALYGVLFLHSRLYGEAALQGVFIALAGHKFEPHGEAQGLDKLPVGLGTVAVGLLEVGHELAPSCLPCRLLPLAAALELVALTGRRLVPVVPRPEHAGFPGDLRLGRHDLHRRLVPSPLPLFARDDNGPRAVAVDVGREPLDECLSLLGGDLVLRADGRPDPLPRALGGSFPRDAGEDALFRAGPIVRRSTVPVPVDVLHQAAAVGGYALYRERRHAVAAVPEQFRGAARLAVVPHEGEGLGVDKGTRVRPWDFHEFHGVGRGLHHQIASWILASTSAALASNARRSHTSLPMSPSTSSSIPPVSGSRWASASASVSRSKMGRSFRNRSKSSGAAAMSTAFAQTSPGVRGGSVGFWQPRPSRISATTQSAASTTNTWPVP